MQLRDALIIVVIVLLLGVAYQQYRLSNVVSTTSATLVMERLDKLDQVVEQIKNQPAIVKQQSVVAPQATNEMDEAFAVGEVGEGLNEVKSRFEGLFVNYQYLKGCGAADAQSYHLLNSALMHELASKNAPARLQYDILTAAQGTYEEIYARSECDAVSLEQMKKGFDAYIENAQKISFVIEN